MFVGCDKMFNTKRVIFIVLFIVSAISLVFVYNDDFLYSKQIIKITKIDTISKEASQNSLGLEEKYYTRKITGIITNGKQKGKKKSVLYDESYSSVVTDKYKVNDKIILDSSGIELKRDFYLTLMIVVFLNLLYIVGSYKGLLSVLSVILNLVIFYVGLFLYFKGINLLFLCVVEMIIFSIISLILASGFNMKTLSAIISVIISTLVMLIIIVIIVNFTGYKGINFNELSFLTVPIEDIILPELLIGTTGAIMDVAITISSSISELIQKDNNISEKNLKKSAREIGKDIMSTMSNVLFFTYLCSGLPIFVLALRNGFSMYNYISTNFTLELTRFLIGSIGIVLTIPVSAHTSIKLMKRGAK